MKKIGLVTIYDEMNFGNRLQNYALQFFLQNTFNVKCVTLIADSSITRRSFFKVELLSLLAKTPFDFKKRSTIDLRYDKFRSFTRHYIKTKRFWGKSRIPQSVGDKFTFFIAGSDQIWNWTLPIVRRHADDFFLSFAEKRKKNSYAASFGIDTLNKEWIDFYRKHLNSFNRISVREDAGRKILSEIINSTAPVNIDPTLLLSSKEWEKIEKKPNSMKIDKPYILSYFLGNVGLVKEDIVQIASKHNLLQVDLLDESSLEYISGPSEFIYWIRHADFICTDSFHATVFAIIFNKPFIVVSRKGMNSRIQTLLKLCKLEDHYVERSRIREEDIRWNSKYKFVNKIIEQEKIKSINYFKRLLQEY